MDYDKIHLFFNVCSNMLKKEEIYLDTIYVVL